MVYNATQTSPKFAELPILPYCQAYLALSGRAPGQAVKHAAPTDCQKLRSKVDRSMGKR